jgi:hypothetical protein
MMAFAARHVGLLGGRKWERSVQDYLALHSVPVEAALGGYQVFGMVSLSGLHHQVDLTFGAGDALVIAECKAYRQGPSKNEILKFKAATDDYFLALGAGMPRKPIMRVFGGPIDASQELRRYAALHGIVLIERNRWPLPFLLSEGLEWLHVRIPSPALASIGWLCRPMQHTTVRQADGSYRMRGLPALNVVDSALALHDRLSEWLWVEVDTFPGRFEDTLSRRFSCMLYSA